MKRSARSTPTGPGSRGGLGHRYADNPAAWNARQKAWRAAHPDYQDRERERGARRRQEALAAQADLVAVTPDHRYAQTFGAWLRAQMVRCRTSRRELGAFAGVAQHTIRRALAGGDLRLSTFAALAAVFGYRVELVRAT